MLCTKSLSSFVVFILRWLIQNLALLTFLYFVIRIIKDPSKRNNLKEEVRVPLAVLISFTVIYGILSIDNIEHAGSIVQCSIKGGEILESGCNDIGCYISYEDWRKECIDDSECKGYCELEEEDVIYELFKKNFPLQYSICNAFREKGITASSEGVNISEWSEKANIKIKGKCSKYASDNPVYPQRISIKDNVLRVSCPVLMIY